MRTDEFCEILDEVCLGALKDWLNEHGGLEWQVVYVDGEVYMLAKRKENFHVMSAKELRDCVDEVRRRKDAGR